jgi:cardiolipin synthase
VGIFAYLMLGETNVGRRNQKAMQRVKGGALHQQTVHEDLASEPLNVPASYAHLFRVGHSISDFPAVAGNTAQLMADSTWRG